MVLSLRQNKAQAASPRRRVGRAEVKVPVRSLSLSLSRFFLLVGVRWHRCVTPNTTDLKPVVMAVLRNKRELKAHIKALLAPLATSDQFLELDEVKALTQSIADGIQLPCDAEEVIGTTYDEVLCFLKEHSASADVLDSVAAKKRQAAPPPAPAPASDPAAEAPDGTAACASARAPSSTTGLNFSALQQRLQKKREELQQKTAGDEQRPAAGPPEKRQRLEKQPEDRPAADPVKTGAKPHAPPSTGTSKHVAAAAPALEGTKADVEAQPAPGTAVCFRVKPLDDANLFADMVPLSEPTRPPRHSSRGGGPAPYGRAGARNEKPKNKTKQKKIANFACWRGSPSEHVLHSILLGPAYISYYLSFFVSARAGTTEVYPMDFSFPEEEGSATNSSIGGIPLHQLPNIPVEDLPPNPSPPLRGAALRDLIAVAVTTPAGSPPPSALDGPSSATAIPPGGLAPPPAKWGPKRRRRSTFNAGELKAFYVALSQFGTDFNLIALHLPDRTRTDVKRLFHRELRKNPECVTRALSEHKDFSETDVLTRIREHEKADAGVRTLGREEEDLLREMGIEDEGKDKGIEAPPKRPRIESPIRDSHTEDETILDFASWSAEEPALCSAVSPFLPPTARVFSLTPPSPFELLRRLSFAGTGKDTLEWANNLHRTSPRKKFGKFTSSSCVALPMATPFVLCSSCRHAYPSTSLEEAAFGYKIREAIESMQTLARKIVGQRPEDKHHLQELQLNLQNLCGSIHEEMGSLRAKMTALEKRVAKKDKDLSAANAKALHATVQSAKILVNPVQSGAPANYTPGEANRAVFNGVPEYHIKRMGTALELVSAGIYSLLESLAIHTRVDTALLWMRPRNLISNELLAPFVVGRDMSKLLSSAPYRVSETSIPCAVSTTGIAVNMKPRGGVHDTRRSEDIPLNEFIEHTNSAQLLVPVHSRYSDTVLAVVHLIGSPRFPFPFNRRNEEAAMHAAAFFATILSSHHDHMINEWANHFYDPSVIQSTSTYRGDLDLRGDDKCVDDFTPPPMLIYRCVNERGADADPRDAFMAMKVAMTKKSAPMQPVSCVKDLHRHAANMETNWVSAVQATSQLENYVSMYKDGVLKDEVERLRQQRERAQEEADKNAAKYSWRQVTQQQQLSAAAASGKRSPNAIEGNASHPPSAGAPTRSPAAIDDEEHDSKNSSINSADLAMGLTPAAVAKADDLDPSDVLKPEEMAEAESLALKRLRNLGVDTSAFVQKKPPPEKKQFPTLPLLTHTAHRCRTKKTLMSPSAVQVRVNGGAEAPPLGQQPMSNFVTNVRKVAIASICFLVLYAAEVFPVMVSTRVHRPFLILSAALFAIFAAMGAYSAVRLSKRNLRWFEEHERFLYAATGIALLGGLAWIIGMWPVYHFFSLPLWLVVVVMVVNINGISFKSPKRVSKRLLEPPSRGHTFAISYSFPTQAKKFKYIYRNDSFSTELHVLVRASFSCYQTAR
eukprot:gene6640-4759_t